MIDLIKKYIETRIELVKMELITVFANVASALVSSFIILIFALFILLMLSFSLAFWLSEILNSQSLGFIIVAGIYTLFFIVYMIYSKKVLEQKVKDEVVKSALEQDQEIKENQAL